MPQSSLALELREDSAPAEEDGFPDDFTPERAASSLAGFQRGTLRARDEGADPQYDQAETTAPKDPEVPVPAAAELPAPPEQPDPAPRLRPPTAHEGR
ncbi:hypothetical protein [Streptomyces sp. NPDC058964]|uniref:hypothetical protein n=1 Tax=Streptomyces sp. NPDC058964 TaxID=3346681 RepID=UPI0036AAA418